MRETEMSDGFRLNLFGIAGTAVMWYMVFIFLVCRLNLFGIAGTAVAGVSGPSKSRLACRERESAKKNSQFSSTRLHKNRDTSLIWVLASAP